MLLESFLSQTKKKKSLQLIDVWLVTGYIDGDILLEQNTGGSGFNATFAVNNLGSVVGISILEHGGNFPLGSEIQSGLYYSGTSIPQVEQKT